MKNISPVFWGTLAAMFVTCYMFLILCHDFSPVMISTLKVSPHFKTNKIIKTAVKEPN